MILECNYLQIRNLKNIDMETLFLILKVVAGTLAVPIVAVALLAILVFLSIIAMIIGYFIFGIIPFAIFKFLKLRK